MDYVYNKKTIYLSSLVLSETYSLADEVQQEVMPVVSVTQREIFVCWRIKVYTRFPG